MGSKLKSIIKYCIVGITLLFIGTFIAKTDFRAVLRELTVIGYRFPLILLTSFCAYIFGTWCWFVCLGSERKKIPIAQLFAIRQICETVGLFNPTSIVGGDMLKIHFLKRYPITEKKALSSVVISRLTVVLSQILLFLITTFWFITTGVLSGLSSFMVNTIYVVLFLLIIAQLSFFYWLTRKKEYAAKTSPVSSKFHKIKNRLYNILGDVKTTYQLDKKSFWKSYLLASLHWIVGGLEFYLILVFLGFDVKIMHGILLDMSVVIFKSIGAFIPGQLGIEELGNKVVLKAVGYGSASLWLTVSLLRRARQIFWIGLGFLFYMGMKKQATYGKTN